MLNILFLGYAVSLEEMELLSGASVAGNKMQVSVLEELAALSDVNLRILTILPIAPFPKDRKIYVKRKEFYINDNLKSIRVAFCNIPIVKQLWQIVSLYLSAKKVIEDDTVILTFNLYPQIGIPLKWIEKKYKCKAFTLLADLPIDDNLSKKNRIRNIFRRYYNKLTEHAIADSEALIVLNQHAIEKYAPKAKFIVVEGGIKKTDVPKFSYCPKKRKNIIYSGALTEYSGILRLIEAMDYVRDKSVCLEIYGDGPQREYVNSLVAEKENVKYYGKISNEEIVRKQKDAFLLINPRIINHPISKVTFPSKIFEYMLSGTAVLSTELNGFSTELKSNIFTMKDDSFNMAKQIDLIAKLPETVLEEKARAAYDFITNEKNWNVQVEKIYNFMKGSIDE